MTDPIVRISLPGIQYPFKLHDNGDGTYSPLLYLADMTRLTISQTPTITAGAYHAKDAVGGKLTFANAALTPGGGGVIRKLVVDDLGAQNADLYLVLFNQDFTATADNAAFDPSDADLANCIGIIPLYASQYVTLNDNSVGTHPTPELHFVLASGTSLYGQLMTSGTPTYTSTSDLKVSILVDARS